MVEAKNVTWDVLEVESPELVRGCEEGLFEKIDFAQVGDKADFVPAAVNECGVGIFVWSTALAYNADRLKEAPTSWADFWNVDKFPGKRGLRKGAKYTLEFALLADGVPTSDVYKVLATPAGVDRAFAKLDKLKANIQWWEAGAQPPQLLASGDLVMSAAYNGRISAAQVEGKNLKVVWNGSIYDVDSWAIPGLAEEGRRAQVHPLRQPARKPGGVLRRDRLRPGQPEGGAGDRRQGRRRPADLAREHEGRDGDRHRVLGRARREPRAALQRLGRALSAAFVACPRAGMPAPPRASGPRWRPRRAATVSI
jgi:hypothetical protein